MRLLATSRKGKAKTVTKLFFKLGNGGSWLIEDSELAWFITLIRGIHNTSDEDVFFMVYGY